MKRFENKIVLVTGAGSGIGKATALRLASEGAAVACADINGESAHATAADIEAAGGSAVGLVCDVSDEPAIKATVEAVIGRYDKLDVLCNVAGILWSSASHDVTLEQWNRIISVNLTGTFFMCRYALPHLVKSKGNIVNTASTAALGGHPWMAAYGASKGGVISMTRVLAIEYVREGVRVNAVCPGGVSTPIHKQFKFPEEPDFDLIRRAMPYTDYGKPEDVAGTIAYLASSDAAYVTGTDLRVDGGALS